MRHSQDEVDWLYTMVKFNLNWMKMKMVQEPVCIQC